MSEQGKYMSRSKKRQSWSWLVAEDFVNFPWYLLHWLGLGPRLGLGGSAKSWLGVLMCWVVKMSVKCMCVDPLDCWMNWWTSCWSQVCISVLVVVRLSVTDWVWLIGHDGLEVSQSVGIGWGFLLQSYHEQVATIPSGSPSARASPSALCTLHWQLWTPKVSPHPWKEGGAHDAAKLHSYLSALKQAKKVIKLKVSTWKRFIYLGEPWSDCKGEFEKRMLNIEHWSFDQWWQTSVIWLFLRVPSWLFPIQNLIISIHYVY